MKRGRDVRSLPAGPCHQATLAVANFGSAGVPAASLAVIAMMLDYLHVPPEVIGFILGVDRRLGRYRTALNLTGDLATAVVVSRHADATQRSRHDISPDSNPQPTDFRATTDVSTEPYAASSNR